jgi:hypothetical protein
VREEGYSRGTGPRLARRPHDPLPRSQGYNCLLFFYGVKEGRAMSVQFRAAFREKVPIQKVNEWNRKKRFLKVYLDEDDDINMDMDVDLEGGVTRDYLAESACAPGAPRSWPAFASWPS